MSGSAQELEAALRDLPATGRLVKDRPYRQVWGFEFDGRGFYLKFFPRGGWREWARRALRGSEAMREFRRLQWLQKAKVPSPRAVAVLVGFRLEGRVGDALVTEGIEGAVQLDEFLCGMKRGVGVGRDPSPQPSPLSTGERGKEARSDGARTPALREATTGGPPVPHSNVHRSIAKQVTDVVAGLGRAGLGHGDLHLGNFVLAKGKVYLLDAHALRPGGLRTKDLLLLGHSAADWATRTDLLRGWRELMEGAAPLPATNSVSRRLWRKSVRRAFGENRYFGRIRVAAWRGFFFKQCKLPPAWSAASRLSISAKDWEAAWPIIEGKIASDQFEVIKRSASGDVLAGEVVLGGRPLEIVLKRPRRRYWYRHVTEIGRGSRARRAWKKAWQLVVRGIPTAWPLLMMEKRRFGYVTDQVLVLEKVAGLNIGACNLANIAVAARERYLRRVGRIVRQIEASGLYLYDAKASNWMVCPAVDGPTPVLVDVDGLRPFRVSGGGFERFIASVRRHRHFRPEDEEAARAGYRPWG